MNRYLMPASICFAIALTAAVAAADRPRDRAGSLSAICERLAVGEGKTVADVGCGSGPDSILFAAIVGERGTVLAEEIDAGKVKEVAAGAREKKLRQVVPILGDSEDPRLPDGTVDLIYLHYVYHHLARPRDMLRSMWRDLRPGGHLVVVEQARGPQRDWAKDEVREKEHHLLGETTIVRGAREEGFCFVDLLDGLWHEPKDTVFAFRKPVNAAEPAGDPDLPPALDGRVYIERLPFQQGRPITVAVVALDGGRAVLVPLAKVAAPSRRILDVVLEEWATSRDETPRVPEGVQVEALPCMNGALAVPPGVVLDAVIFADAYHRIWDAPAVIGALARFLAPGGFIAITDREGPAEEPRRLAGHRRRISPALVRDELARAGFDAGAGGPDGAGRFALVFRPRPGARRI